MLRECLFGGDTATVLTHGAYRGSVGVDLIVPSKGEYRELRGLVSVQGILALMKNPVTPWPRLSLTMALPARPGARHDEVKR